MHIIPPIFQSILSNLSNILLFDLDITYPKTDKVDKIQTPPSPQFNVHPNTPIKIYMPFKDTNMITTTINKQSNAQMLKFSK